MRKYTELEMAEGAHIGQATRGRCPIDVWYPHRKPGDVFINYDMVADNLAVGSVPITLADMAKIKNDGFGAVLDLCGDQSRESQWAKSHGLSFLHEFVHDGYSPTQAQFKRITKWISSHTESGTKVYVHCHAGAGRAPTAAIAYLVYMYGYDVDRAKEVLRARRRHHIVSARQVLGLRTFESSIRRPS